MKVERVSLVVVRPPKSETPVPDLRAPSTVGQVFPGASGGRGGAVQIFDDPVIARVRLFGARSDPAAGLGRNFLGKLLPEARLTRALKSSLGTSASLTFVHQVKGGVFLYEKRNR